MYCMHHIDGGREVCLVREGERGGYEPFLDQLCFFRPPERATSARGLGKNGKGERSNKAAAA